jgi:hypothetical protein
MRAYNVNIMALHNGKEVHFMEVIAFPLQPLGRSGSVNKVDREAGAVEQIRIKYPQLQNIRATGSKHIASDSSKEPYLPLWSEHTIPNDSRAPYLPFPS